jgi:protein-tyrosine phosphatase
MLCLGNICRSPLAEGLLKSKISSKQAYIDSAGLDGWHEGEPPCESSRKVARKHGLNIDHLRARKFTIEDFDRFDKIYIMDHLNYEMIKKLARNEDDMKKVEFIMNELYPGEDLDVPDSYQKGAQAAELIYQMLDQATDKIAQKISS